MRRGSRSGRSFQRRVCCFRLAAASRGLIGGGVGAAEYEALVGAPGAGMKRVSTLSIVHTLVIALVVVGNVVYLRQRRSEGAIA